MLSILVTNNHLKNYGGSETFTYALVEALIKYGHKVEYFTFEKGLTSQKIETNLKVPFFSNKAYDIVFANHNSCISFLRKIIPPKTTIVQTCHGVFPDLEQPSPLANFHVSISEEVQNHLQTLGYTSEIILNGINTQRFINKTPPNQKLKSVLSLCQSEDANKAIQQACTLNNIQFNSLNKFTNGIWNVEDEINKVDLVIGLGRSAYEAMTCGRAVVIYDNRPYSESFADGYLTQGILNEVIKNNCSGRTYKKKYTFQELSNEFSKYNPKDGNKLRLFAEKFLNIDIQTKKYLEYALQKSKPKAKNNSYKYYYLKNLQFLITLPYFILKIPFWYKSIKKRPLNIQNYRHILTTAFDFRLNKKEIKNYIDKLH